MEITSYDAQAELCE